MDEKASEFNTRCEEFNQVVSQSIDQEIARKIGGM